MVLLARKLTCVRGSGAGEFEPRDSLRKEGLVRDTAGRLAASQDRHVQLLPSEKRHEMQNRKLSSIGARSRNSLLRASSAPRPRRYVCKSVAKARPTSETTKSRQPHRGQLRCGVAPKQRGGTRGHAYYLVGAFQSQMARLHLHGEGACAGGGMCLLLCLCVCV